MVNFWTITRSRLKVVEKRIDLFYLCFIGLPCFFSILCVSASAVSLFLNLELWITAETQRRGEEKMLATDEHRLTQIREKKTSYLSRLCVSTAATIIKIAPAQPDNPNRSFKIHHPKNTAQTGSIV
jgi:hypothetical protein